MKRATSVFENGAARWPLLAGVVAAIVLAGCGGQQTTRQPAPGEQVAGERQEDTVMQEIRSAGLPERFAFGGREWQGHEIHEVDAQEVAASVPAEVGTTGTKDTGTTGPGPTGTEGNTETDDSAGTEARYFPLPGMMVQGHQVYRLEGADEAMTDNIFLRAEDAGSTGDTEATGTDAGADSTSGTNTATGTDAATGAGGAAPGAEGMATGDSAAKVRMVEYDAARDLLENVDFPQLLNAAGLVQTMNHAGKDWTAREMQRYDADVFDEMRPLAQKINGKTAYQGDDKDQLFLMAEVDPSALATGTTEDAAGTGTTGTGTTGTRDTTGSTGSPTTGTSGTESTTDTTGGTGTTSSGESAAESPDSDAAMRRGLIFIRYESGDNTP